MIDAGNDRPEAVGNRSIRFITHSPPAPGISGDRIRVYNLMRELKRRGWVVRLWSLVGPNEPVGFADALGAVADEIVLVPRGLTTARRLGWLLRDTLTSQAFQAHWFWSPTSGRAAFAWLADAAKEPLFVEQLYMYPFIPASLRGRVVLDTQNHETARMRAIARSEGGIGRRLVARLQIGPVERYERDALMSVGCVLAVSAAEAEAFEALAPGRVHVVPNGVDVGAIVAVSTPAPSRELLFLGSLGYSANRDAVRHFVADIAPRLVGSGVSLTIVGSDPGKAVHEAAARSPVPVTVAGYVPDVTEYFLSSRAMIVPLRHGAGTRLKILEALAWGLPVVTTSIGGAGLGLANGTHALIADEPSAFAAAVERIAGDDALWARLSAAGRALVEERFSWLQIGDLVDAAVRDM